MDALLSPTAALPAYEALAPYYDELTAGYDHERWITVLEAACGLADSAFRRVLDLGCGTGRAFAALERRGHEVVGCDLSPAMVKLARTRSERAALHVADMRALPPLGSFDWVLCLDDAVNYLVTDEDLAATLAGIRDALAPGGTVCFDVNTEKTYRESFTSDHVVAGDGLMLAWRGLGKRLEGDVPIARAQIECFALQDATGSWSHACSEHVQRHWSAHELTEALIAAGLEPVAALGQSRGCHLETSCDELVHTKTVHIARRPEEVS